MFKISQKKTIKATKQTLKQIKIGGPNGCMIFFQEHAQATRVFFH
jgi:hypothetical protein